MEDLTIVFTFVAKILIYCGGIAFLTCFIMGAYTIYQIFSTTLYTIKITKMWQDFNKLSPEAKMEALKSDRFNK
jgi:hypothetical protein